MKERNNEFDQLYDEYSKEVEGWSGGLVTTDKTDFLKFYAFYATVIQRDINKLVEAYTGKKFR